jgi:hypothetical protein
MSDKGYSIMEMFHNCTEQEQDVVSLYKRGAIGFVKWYAGGPVWQFVGNEFEKELKFEYPINFCPYCGKKLPTGDFEHIPSKALKEYQG